MSSLTSVDFAPEMGAYRKGANAALEGVRPAFVNFFYEALGLPDCVSDGALFSCPLGCDRRSTTAITAFYS
jgi:hypothetical protein